MRVKRGFKARKRRNKILKLAIFELFTKLSTLHKRNGELNSLFNQHQNWLLEIYYVGR